MKTQMTTGLKLAKVLMTALSLSLMLSACTKSRDNKIADDKVAEELMSIAELQADGYQAKLGDQAQASEVSGREISENDKTSLATNQKPTFAAQGMTVPGKLKGLLSGIRIEGKPGTQVTLKFMVRSTGVFVMKKVESKEELSLLDEDLFDHNFLPLYVIPVKSMGILIQKKNDDGETSYQQELRETDLTRATHVQLDLRPEKLQAVRISPKNPKENREIFVADQLRGRVTDVKSLEALLQTNLGLQNPAEKIVTQLLPDVDTASTKVQVNIYSLHRIGDIHDPKLLAKLASENNEILACSAAIQQQSGMGQDCVQVLERTLSATSVRAKLELNETGQPTSNVVFDEVSSGRPVRLLKLAENTPAQDAGPEVLRRFNPTNTIRVADIVTDGCTPGQQTANSSCQQTRRVPKEFLFRRTFEDGASSLSEFGPGASGNMEIVRIEMEDERIVVRRVDSVNAERKAGEIDREELMSIPVKYLKLKNENGILLAQPREATRFDADIISLDWTKNTLPTTNSPLAFFDSGRCFAATGHQSIADMDMRLSTGILNFSIAGSYTFLPECMSSFGLHDYWYGANMQATFNLKERISFRAYTTTQAQEDAELVNPNRPKDLAFRAQTLMGLGIFTMGRRIPDQFGNFGRVQNELALPVIQNFENGKTMKYTLGGLPTTEPYRQIFIDTTKQVIVDWNETLHRAFKGTYLDRETDYVLLEVQGDPGVVPGHLGDLDRNYIWNFDKNLDSGLLGLSQSASNPRTGLSEANNVLMYSGNLLAYIAAEKASSKVLKQYYDLQKTASAQVLADVEKAKAEIARGQSTVRPSTNPADVNIAQQLVRSWAQIAGERPAPHTPRMTLMNRIDIKDAAQKLRSVRTTGEDLRAKKAQVFDSITTEKVYLERIIDKALQMNVGKDESMMQALSAAEVLKAYGPRLSPEERQALIVQSRHLALKAEFEKGFRMGSENNKDLRKGPGCIFSVEGIPTLSGDALVSLPETEIFRNWYAKTLSHEIGHSLGLTHNFKGSVDKANFAYAGEEPKRDYSSVMDYFPGDHINYQKPGPYDAHALRAGYTGEVEVTDAGKQALAAAGGQALVRDGQYIKLNDLQKFVLPQRTDSRGQAYTTWWDANGQSIAKVPLKYYGFCTDIHAGSDPMCNRWDHGTTPTEVVKFYIKEYQDLYPIMNTRGDRIKLVGLGSYLGRISTDFIAIRTFLDETFYRAIQGYPDVGTYVPATVEAYKFFMNVFNTPQINADVMDAKRFIPVEYDKSIPKVDASGKPVMGTDGEQIIEKQKTVAVVEAKPVDDQAETGFDDETVRRRGIEYDKIFALMMLTQRDVGNPRYASIGLKLSFAEFEKYAMGMDPSASPILGALKRTLSDNMTSVLMLDGGVGRGPIEAAPKTTDSLRYFSVMSAAVFLQSNSLEDKDNFASFFRVGSSLNTPPTDRPLATKPDQDANSRVALKFWAFDNADMAATLVRDAAQKRLIMDQAGPMVDAFFKITTAPDEAAAAKMVADAAVLLESLNKNNVLLDEDEKKAGVTFEILAKFVVTQAQKMLGLLKAIQTEAKTKGIPDNQVVAAAAAPLEKMKKNNETNVKNLPLVLIASKLLEKIAAGDPVAKALVEKMVVKEDFLKTNLGVITNNLQTLNKIVNMLNPELNR